MSTRVPNRRRDDYKQQRAGESQDSLAAPGINQTSNSFTHQDGHARQGGNNVSREFRSGKRKENQRHQNPCEREDARAVEHRRSTPVPSAGRKQARAERNRPGKRQSQQYRDVKIKRSRMMKL